MSNPADSVRFEVTYDDGSTAIFTVARASVGGPLAMLSPGSSRESGSGRAISAPEL